MLFRSLGTPGAPGSANLFGEQPHAHLEFAEQIAAEQLIDRAVGSATGSQMYRWATTPGVWHDYGDVMTMAYAGAGWRGIVPGGKTANMLAPKRKRQITTLAI